MSSVTKDQVMEQLKTVIEPASGKDIVSLKMVSAVEIKDGAAFVTLEVDPAKGAALEPLRQAAESAAAKTAGVTKATVVMTAERKSPPPLNVRQKPQHPSTQHRISQRPVAPGVKQIVAVASGKGGVGKSTVSANLALALHAQGKRVGLLDGDIYGSSIPVMLGLREKPETDDGDMIVPPVAHGIKFMSMGFFVEPDAPVIWRGPMVHAAIQQLLRDVAWGDLDVLVIDLPPGTGDAQLSLAQYVPVAGAVIVSTPQDVALNEARKGLNMFAKTGVPVLGMVENMSYHNCASCGHREDIFGHGGVKTAAAQLGVDFLGEIPLLTAIRIAADNGKPIVVADPAHPAAVAFRALADTVSAKLAVAPPAKVKTK
ncbi:MAG: P-loop NTPase [Alphaproteobacteria bacterium]